MHERYVFRLLMAVLFLLIVFLGLGVYWEAWSKELPLVVGIDELSLHDGERVAVDGWIRSEEYFRGRMGSDNLRHRFGNAGAEVFLYSIFPTYALHEKVTVIGVYHSKGWFAGHIIEHFIVAETVVRDWRR